MLTCKNEHYAITLFTVLTLQFQPQILVIIQTPVCLTTTNLITSLITLIFLYPAMPVIDVCQNPSNHSKTDLIMVILTSYESILQSVMTFICYCADFIIPLIFQGSGLSHAQFKHLCGHNNPSLRGTASTSILPNSNRWLQVSSIKVTTSQLFPHSQ